MVLSYTICGGTSRVMMEVDRRASRTMKVCGATESIWINSIRKFNYLCDNRYEMAYRGKITA